MFEKVFFLKFHISVQVTDLLSRNNRDIKVVIYSNIGRMSLTNCQRENVFIVLLRAVLPIAPMKKLL